MAYLSEAAVAQLVLEHLQRLNYAISSDAQIGPDGKSPEREAYADVNLVKRLTAAIEKLNPTIPKDAQGDAIRQVLAIEKPSLVEENRRLHRLMVEGVDVEFYSEDGTIRGDKVRLIDFDNFAANDWLATGQFTVVEGSINRRPDVVVFVNGLPIGVIELKAPGGESASLAGAYNQLQTYKKQIPSLFRTNAVLITSDGITARIGSLTADQERFMPWRTTDGEVIAAKGLPELNTLRSQKSTQPRRRWRHFHDHPEVRPCRWRNRFSHALRSPQHRGDRRRGPPQPIRVQSPNRGQDRRNRLWLREVPA